MATSYTPQDILLQTYNQPRTVGRNSALSGSISNVDILQGITVTLVGTKYPTPKTTTTDAFGTYFFAGLLPDLYTVAPTPSAQFTYSPSSIAVNVQIGNYTGNNFTGVYNGLHFDPLPNIPSSFANPIGAGDFAVGFTIIPLGGSSIFFDNSTLQTAIAAGPYANTNSWSFGITNGSGLQQTVNTTPQPLNPFLTQQGGASPPSSGIVSSIFAPNSPGIHNYVYAQVGGNWYAYVDGAVYDPSPIANSIASQQTPIWIGQFSNGSFPILSSGSYFKIKNLKIATTAAQVTTVEPLAGPGTAPIGAFFGDSMTVGVGSNNPGPANIGGYATQIANARLGTRYYYNAAWTGAQLSLTTPKILTTAWANWGKQQAFAALCLMAGYNDVWGGETSANLISAYTSIASDAYNNGCRSIVLCTIPPGGANPSYSAPKEAVRQAANTGIRNLVASNPTKYTLADADLTLRDPAAPQNFLAAYLSTDNIHPSSAGHAALYTLLNPLLP